MSGRISIGGVLNVGQLAMGRAIFFRIRAHINRPRAGFLDSDRARLKPTSFDTILNSL